MARQALGKSKHAKCEAITGKKYRVCLVRGGTHFWAICERVGEHQLSNADYVNYKTGEWEPYTREGKFAS